MQGAGTNPVTDPVAWELERLDRELNPTTLSDLLVSSCPLACPALGLMSGLIIQHYISLPGWVWLSVALAAVMIGGACYWRLRTRRPLYPAAVGCFLVFVCVGALRLEGFFTPASNDLSHCVGEERELATIRGTLVSDVRRENRQGWAFGRFQWTEPGSSFLLSVEETETVEGWQEASGRVFVYVAGPVRHVGAQDRVEVYCWLSRFESPANPGQFNFKRYMENQGIFLSASVPDPCGVRRLEAKGRRAALPAALQARLRLWAQEALEAWGGSERQYSSLPEALLLGGRSGIDAKTYAAFQKTGLAHYISLSGMHVGILAGFCWVAGRAAGLLKRPRAVLCIVLITLYALVVPPRAATLRAVFLAEFFFVSILLVRRPHSLNTLALTAMVMLLIRPTDLFAPGWQLSYSTVLGILLLTGRIQYRLGALLRRCYPVFNKVLPEVVRRSGIRLTHKFLDLLSVGLAAWLGGAGILAWHFGILTPLSALWTILVFPLVLIILLFGMGKLLLAQALPTLSLILNIIVDRAGDLFAAATVAIADLNWLTFQIGRVSIILICLYYLWLICAFFPRRLPGRRPVVLGLGGFLLITPLLGQRIAGTFQKELKLTFLSVGHGLAAVIESPDGQTFLLDCGSISVKDSGGRVVVPFLRHKGIGRLDGVLVSHGDLDHYNGIPEVLDGVEVESVWLNAGFLHKSQLSASTALMHRRVEAGEYATQERLEWSGKGFRIVSLWPDTTAAEQATMSDNDRSEVLLIEYAGRRVLLCGDIEAYGQQQLLAKYPDLKTDVLLVPHHGSRNNVMPQFVESLGPSVAVISCAERRLGSILVPDQSQTQTWTTAEHGAITIKIKADGTLSTVGFLNSQ